MSEFALRPYQDEAIAAVAEAEQRGVSRPLISLPTGCGKTVIFSHLLGQRPGKSLVLAHRDELIQQAADKIRSVVPDRWVGVVKAQTNETLADIIVASVQTLSQPKRLAMFAPGEFPTIVIDEAHHAVAETYRKIVDHLEPELLLGVTATPMRGDEVGLDHVFEEIVYDRTILEMISKGWLCDLRAKRVELQIDFSKLKISRGDFQQGQAGEMLMEADAPHLVARAYSQFAKERKGLVFTPTVEVAHACAQELRALGIAAEGLDGTTPTDERRAILARLKTGETQVVANCAVLTEGFDEPSIECIVMARPTKSKTLYMQCIGRGTRSHPGKKNCLVLDLCGNTVKHDLLTLPDLLGLSLEHLKKAEDSVIGAVQEAEKDGQQTFANGRLVAVDVDLMKSRTDASWIDGGGRYAMSVGNGMVLVERVDDTVVRIIHDAREGERAVLREFPDEEMALGWAEAWAKKQGAQALIDPQAKWRRDRATEKQLASLAKNRIPHDPSTITKGEASALIGRLVARGGRRKRA